MNLSDPNVLSLFIIICLVVLVLLFILGREIVCWYFKINDIKKLLEKIEENTRKKE